MITAKEQANLPNNMKFIGEQYVPELDADLHVFTLNDKSPEEWNAMAKRTNIKTFIAEFGREPVDYKEVLEWINSLIRRV